MYSLCIFLMYHKHDITYPEFIANKRIVDWLQTAIAIIHVSRKDIHDRKRYANKIRFCSKINGIKFYIFTEIIKFISHQLCSFLWICLFQFQSKPLIMKEIYCTPIFQPHPFLSF